ncbi:MAG: cytochrome c biogenesis protein CcsA [Sedimentisphaerales bacterium]|jgi:ABC-type transport system involved in cytochrome c biogenesis permease subunit
MAIKYTIQGLLIYAAMAGYLLAFVVMLSRQRKTGHILFLAGFLVGCAALAYRWVDVRHIPLQNLFEVFLCLGVLAYPISVFCNRILRVGGVAADMLIGVIVLFPAGFVFSAEPQQLPPALQSWLFGPHVLVYMLSYILMTKAAVQAAAQLSGGQAKDDLLAPEEATYRTVCAGFPLLTLGLVLGSIWGQNAWGDWWGWDPKELWSLASWLVYVGYFHFRYMFGKRFPRINSLWAVVGLIVIIITLLWVNLSRLFPGLHNYAM